MVSRSKATKFSFTDIIDPASVKKPYEEIVKYIKPTLSRLMDGKSGSIFSIGGPASGKTFCLQGVKHDPGVLPLTIFHIFKIIEKQNLKTVVSCTITEVDKYGYNRDLLHGFDDEGKSSCTIERADATVGLFDQENTHHDARESPPGGQARFPDGQKGRY